MTIEAGHDGHNHNMEMPAGHAGHESFHSWLLLAMFAFLILSQVKFLMKKKKRKQRKRNNENT